MDNATFRQNFPEFNSSSDYSDPMLTFWSSVASAYVDKTRWQGLYDVGMSLALAHHLVLAKNNKIGGQPGNNTGLINSQSVGDVSANFDTNNTTEERGGQWNLTTYGQQFLRMARLVGGCAVQIM